MWVGMEKIPYPRVHVNKAYYGHGVGTYGKNKLVFFYPPINEVWLDIEISIPMGTFIRLSASEIT